MEEEKKMSIKEANRLSFMKQVDKKMLTVLDVSRELGLSYRQVKRIRKRYLNEGAKGLISLKRGQVRNRKIGNRIHQKVMKLMTTKYVGFGPTLAQEN